MTLDPDDVSALVGIVEHMAEHFEQGTIYCEELSNARHFAPKVRAQLAALAASEPAAGDGHGHELNGAYCTTHATYEDHFVAATPAPVTPTLDAVPVLRLTGEQLDAIGNEAFFVDWDEFDEFVRVEDAARLAQSTEAASAAPVDPDAIAESERDPDA